ncbi:unnamed protein product [Lampetra fluviatilis]
MADSDSNGGGGCIEATGSSPTPPKAPCPLLKKNSQTDLLSRLKTRKVLGVGGEDDEGEAHRSKVSGDGAPRATPAPPGSSTGLAITVSPAVRKLQAALSFVDEGHNEGTTGWKYFSDNHQHRCRISSRQQQQHQPQKPKLWQLVSATMFTVIAGMALVIPDKLYEVLFEERSTQGSLSMRLYGGTLLCISLVLWNAFYTADKAIIRWSLALQASYFIVQMGVTVFAVWERGTAPENLALLLSSRALFTLVACFYHRSVGRRTKKQH